MFDFSEAVQVIQAAMAATGPNYKGPAEMALTMAWARAGAAFDWWFLRSGTPYPLTTVVGQAGYTLEKAEMGTILYIGTELGVPLVGYRDWDAWKQALAGGVTVEEDRSEPSSSSIFTVAGLDGANKRILIYPTPSTATTLYVWYQFTASRDNFDKCPPPMMKALIHGAKSIIAPPKALDIPGRRAQWESLQMTEHNLFISEIDELARVLQAARVHRQPWNNDPWIESQLKDINET